MSLELQCAHGFAERHPTEAARVLEQLPAEVTAGFFAEEPAPTAAELVGTMIPAAGAEAIGALDGAAAGAILTAMPADTAARVLRRIPVERRELVLAACDGERQNTLRQLLGFSEGTVGATADPTVVALPEDLPVEEARNQIQRRDAKLHHHVFVIDRDQRVQGVVHMRDLLRAGDRQRLGDIMQTADVQLPASARVADVTVHPAWRALDALPVVDRDERLIGILRHRDVRNLEVTPTSGSALTTLLSLGELYWLGLSTVLAGSGAVASGSVAAEGGQHD